MLSSAKSGILELSVFPFSSCYYDLDVDMNAIYHLETDNYDNFVRT